MSEYQYYEFLALDKPLTPEQIDAVGEFSSRADISSTRFVNSYNWGNFRGNVTDFLTRYFDLHVYVANWGTRCFAMALPGPLLDLPMVKDYEVSDSFDIHTKANRVILTVTSNEDGGDGDYEGEGWMASLAPLREELIAGDLRVLYLAWLAGVAQCLLDDDETEPPVPAGLGKLTAAQETFADFMRIDNELLEVAAQASPEQNAAQPDAQRFLSGLPAQEKETLLLAVLEGRATEVASGLRTRLRRACPVAGPAKSSRTVSELRAAADKLSAAHERLRAEEHAHQKAQAAAKAAATRAQYLRDIAPRKEQLWSQILQLVAMTTPKSYDQAVNILRDLRDLAAAADNTPEFQRRLQELRANHLGKPSFQSRLNKAGLGS